MFCPVCKAEYRSGFTTCSDCHVQLVSVLPEDSQNDPEERYLEYEEVLFTFNPADIAFIKSILDGEDIAYYFQGEQFTYVDPLIVPARLMVEKEQIEQVRVLLREAKLSIIGVNYDSSETKEDIDD
jgi:hypothetical protein